MDISQRAKLLLEKLNISQKDIASMLGISPPRLNNYLTGKHNFPYNILVKLSELTNAELTWLLTGEGDMFNTVSAVDSALSKLISIPVVAAIAAGPAIEVYNDEPLEVIQVPTTLLTLPPPYYAFRVEGESMSPYIIDGDTVILSRDWRGVDLADKICGFRTPDGITLKKLMLQPRKKTAWLMPLNHSYHPVEYTRDTPDLTLIGILILSIRKYI